MHDRCQPACDFGSSRNMDAILEVSQDVLLEQLPVDKETKAVLLGQNSSLRPLFQWTLAQKSGEWAESSKLAKGLKLTDEEVSSTWFQALPWAQATTGAV
ncbi:MAG: hypothetical protein WCB11_06075 [Terriglobales bacterium]